MNHPIDPSAHLPSGQSFDFWEKEQVYDRELHVSEKCGSDETGDGSLRAPYRSINRASAEAVAGTRVLIHAGEYRECVRVQHGGESPQRMVSFEAAGDGDVVIKATEIAAGFSPSTEFRLDFRSQSEARL